MNRYVEKTVTRKNFKGYNRYVYLAEYKGER